MKKIKIALSALLIVIILVGSFAFTSKPCYLMSYRYFAPNGNNIADANQYNCIISSELTADELPGDGQLDNWMASSVSSHISGSKLYGIEFYSNQLSMEEAGYAVRLYYSLLRSLPEDGCVLLTPVDHYNIWIYRY